VRCASLCDNDNVISIVPPCRVRPRRCRCACNTDNRLPLTMRCVSQLTCTKAGRLADRCSTEVPLKVQRQAHKVCVFERHAQRVLPMPGAAKQR
jgi:hypothetical protein